MCCFSRRVQVGNTRIFARMVAPGRQGLAYQMQFSADAPVAMVLPIPTPPSAPEDAVRFIALDGFPGLFDALQSIFEMPSRGAPQAKLRVHTVGDFIASFVPSLANMGRLDPQFRMPAGTLDRIPAIADWGFAVFQLAAAKRGTVHPMAFEFSTRARDRLFFPTLHVHDGVVHPMAAFDHALYAQASDPLAGFRFSDARLGDYLRDHARAGGLFDPDAQVARRLLRGDLLNEDTWVSL